MKTVLLLATLPALCAPLLHGADLDNDGLPDDTEELLAESFLPRIYFHEEEACAGPGVILYHARPFAPGVDSIVSLTYVLLFYDDCGGIVHKGDAETFSLTLFEDGSCPLGYRAHSIRTCAHAGIPVCDYRPSYTIESCSFSHEEGNAVYCSKNSHAVYTSLSICNDPERWYCLDECQAVYVMNDGWLVPPEADQYWHLYNAGEVDYPFITDVAEIGNGMFDFASCPVWDFRHFCGDEPYNPGDYCPSTIVNKLFTCSTGPTLPVDVSFRLGGAVPSPMGYCRDQFLYLDLPYGGNVFAHIYSIAGDVVDKVYLPAFCASEELIASCWDGGSLYGGCSAPGNYYLQAEAQRGDDHAFTDIIRFGVSGDEGGPRSPSNLEGSGNSHAVTLTWNDRSQVEDAYIVERSLGTCPYSVVGVLPENTTTWTDTPLAEGLARYRVCAHRTFGGNSEYSNEIQLDLRWDVTAPVLSGAERGNPHAHFLSWSFDPGGVGFDRYVLSKRYRCPPGSRNDGGQPPGWSVWFDIHWSDIVTDTMLIDSLVTWENCYEYRVEAVIEDWTDTLCSNIVNFHGDCEEHGCAALSVHGDDGWRRKAYLFTAPEVGSSRGNAVDIVDLGVLSGSDDGPMAVRIGEISVDTTFLDAVLLHVIEDGGGGERMPGIVTERGIALYEHRRDPLTALTREGTDVLGPVSREDGVLFSGQPGDELVLEFGESGEEGDTLLGILDGPVEDPPAKAVWPLVFFRGGKDRSGTWTPVSSIAVRGKSANLIDLGPFIRNFGRDMSLRIVWNSPLAIDRLFLAAAEAVPPAVTRLDRALTDEGLDVTHLLLHDDGERVHLEKGEYVTLYLDHPSEGRATHRFFLEARGFTVPGISEP